MWHYSPRRGDVHWMIAYNEELVGYKRRDQRVFAMESLGSPGDKKHFFAIFWQ